MELDLHAGWFVSDGCRLLRTVEVSLGHVRDVGTAGLGPEPHAVRVFLCVCLDGRGDTAIGISLSQDRVDGTAHNGLVRLLDFDLALVLWFAGVDWNVVALGTQLGNAILELVEGSRNVGKLNDVGIRSLCHFPEIREIVWNTLVRFELVGEEGQDAARQRNVAGDDVDIREGADLVHYGKETVGCECRGFVGFCVNDRRLGIGKRCVGMVRRGGGRDVDGIGCGNDGSRERFCHASRDRRREGTGVATSC
mmetsp:Transcript_8440/g.17569  ORF Transcript_8440/g.17569 Transcript_8440/m.17569 type:complete len:251 (-) Transcript_8440:102-854(-)